MEQSRESQVYLPLYSKKAGRPYIPDYSGLNQWLAAGRRRRLGECYFPVPAIVHRKAPNFFPERNTSFTLEMPGGLLSEAKICQSGGKALMTAPNHHLGIWLFNLMDPEPGKRIERFLEREPYKYANLLSIGFDSVIVECRADRFIMTPAGIGSFEFWAYSSIDDGSNGSSS